MSVPVIAGEIPEEGIIPLLSTIEHQRTTGVLRFTNGMRAGQVNLIRGQIGLDQTILPDGADPVETLLACTHGDFEVFQCLPTLPVTGGDENERTGSLEVHAPADIMNYCENAGLTGTLTFEQYPAKSEMIYDRGEIHSIRLEYLDDLNEVFAWEEGAFRVAAHTTAPVYDPEPEGPPTEKFKIPDPSALPPERTRRVLPDTVTGTELRIVEVLRDEIMEEKERRRPKRGPAHESEITRDSVEMRPSYRVGPPPFPSEPPSTKIPVFYVGSARSQPAADIKVPPPAPLPNTDLPIAIVSDASASDRPTTNTEEANAQAPMVAFEAATDPKAAVADPTIVERRPPSFGASRSSKGAALGNVARDARRHKTRSSQPHDEHRSDSRGLAVLILIVVALVAGILLWLPNT